MNFLQLFSISESYDTLVTFNILETFFIALFGSVFVALMHFLFVHLTTSTFLRRFIFYSFLYSILYIIYLVLFVCMKYKLICHTLLIHLKPSLKVQ